MITRVGLGRSSDTEAEVGEDLLATDELLTRAAIRAGHRPPLEGDGVMVGGQRDGGPERART